MKPPFTYFGGKTSIADTIAGGAVTGIVSWMRKQSTERSRHVIPGQSVEEQTNRAGWWLTVGANGGNCRTFAGCLPTPDGRP